MPGVRVGWQFRHRNQAGQTSGKKPVKKEQVIGAIRAFAEQRSGIDFRHYQSGNWKESRRCFMGDYRPMLRAGRDARVLLAAVSGRDAITAEAIQAGTRAYAGRLQLVERDGAVAVDYCTGQYFPTEYRQAACAVLGTVLWDYAVASGYDTREKIQKWARQEFGRGIASRWFH